MFRFVGIRTKSFPGKCFVPISAAFYFPGMAETRRIPSFVSRCTQKNFVEMCLVFFPAPSRVMIVRAALLSDCSSSVVSWPQNSKMFFT